VGIDPLGSPTFSAISRCGVAVSGDHVVATCAAYGSRCLAIVASVAIVAIVASDDRVAGRWWGSAAVAATERCAPRSSFGHCPRADACRDTDDQ
jgi:hypothetical protein